MRLTREEVLAASLRQALEELEITRAERDMFARNAMNFEVRLNEAEDALHRLANEMLADKLGVGHTTHHAPAA